MSPLTFESKLNKKFVVINLTLKGEKFQYKIEGLVHNHDKIFNCPYIVSV